jgi:hypothetical protein
MFQHSNYIMKSRSELSDETLRQRAPSIFAPQAIAEVSDRYTFLPTSQIVAAMRQAGWAPVEVQEQRVRLENRKGFQRHMIRFQRKDQIAVAGEYTAELALLNSHDATSAYQLHAALFRFACGNGLMIGDGTLESLRIRHSGFSPEKLIEASFAMAENLPKVTARVDQMKARRLTPPESEQFATEALQLRYEDLTLAPVEPGKLLRALRYDDAGDDLWRVLNRSQEHLTRGGLKGWRRNPEGKTIGRMRAVTGLTQSIDLNLRLWSLAEKWLSFPA